MYIDVQAAPDWAQTRPLIKWTGGKSSELDVIRRALPRRISRYLEPFVGGGAVLFAMPPSIPAAVNDRSQDLITLYRLQSSADDRLMSSIRAIHRAWTALNQIDCTASDKDMVTAVMKAARPLGPAFGRGVLPMVEQETRAAIARKQRFLSGLRDKGEESGVADDLILSALKGGVYTALRAAYNAETNPTARAALFWYIRGFCYGGMFRTNAAGAFNVPYGGISYNQRSMDVRLKQLKDQNTLSRLLGTEFHCGDFSAFFRKVRPKKGDFVFLDPPYDSPFSTYDGNAFTRDDHRRLADHMRSMKANWMMVISETEFVRECYCNLPGARVSSFGKLYQGNIKGRVDTKATHLMITNYDWAS